MSAKNGQAVRRNPDKAIADTVASMNAAGYSLQDAGDRLLRAGFDLVAECIGAEGARRWAWRHLEHLARNGEEPEQGIVSASMAPPTVSRRGPRRRARAPDGGA